MKKTIMALALSLGMSGALMGTATVVTLKTQQAYAQATAAPATPAVPAVAPAVTAAPAAEVAPAPKAEDECSISCVLTNFQKVFTDWKALGWQAGLMALLVLIVSTFKNTLLRKWLWDWAGEAKSVIPYVLAMLICLLAIPQADWSFATVLLALTTGGGAVALHQLLDSLKAAPWIGEKYKWIVELIGKWAKKPADAKTTKVA